MKVHKVFHKGDKVRWTSQAGGSTKLKRGVVVGIVAPNTRPDRGAFAGLYRSSGCGFGRDHESYVVAVGKGGSKIYWPRVSALALDEEAK